MKNIILAGLIGLVSATAFAESPTWAITTPEAATPKASVSVEYSKTDATFAENTEVSLDGFAVGISSSPQKNGFWGKFEGLGNDEYDGNYYEISVGGHISLVSSKHFYALATAGIGAGWLDVDGFDSTTYFSIPVGLEAGVNFTPNISVYGGIGYKWALDVSDNQGTRCRDGSWSDSTGSGTCSWHGGIDYYYNPNYIGDFDGVTYKAGLRYNF